MYVVRTMQSNKSLPVLGNTELRPTNEIREYDGRNLTFLLFCYPTDLMSLANPFDSIFKFGVFNIIQSKCIDDVMRKQTLIYGLY